MVSSVALSCSGAAGSWCKALTKITATVTVTDLKPGGTAAAVATIEINPLPGKNHEEEWEGSFRGLGFVGER